MKKLTALVALSSIATCALTTVQADPISETRTMTVHYGDLNTTNSLGAAALYARIHHAAKVVCQGFESNRNLPLTRQYEDCVHQALVGAIADVNQAAVTAYAATRGIVPAETTTKIAFNK
jgi:UrcA family protein